jgi:hypothetical protein
VLSTEVFHEVAAPALQVVQVELPTMLATIINPDPSVGKECQMTDLDTVVEEGARRMDLKAARSLPEVVADTWKVHRLWEILPTISWVPGYSKNPIT